MNQNHSGHSTQRNNADENKSHSIPVSADGSKRISDLYNSSTAFDVRFLKTFCSDTLFPSFLFAAFDHHAKTVTTLDHADSSFQPSPSYPPEIVSYYNVPRAVTDRLSHQDSPINISDLPLHLLPSITADFDDMLLCTDSLRSYSTSSNSSSSTPSSAIVIATHMCQQCLTSLRSSNKANNPPKFAIANGLAFGACPISATTSEWRMVTQCVPKLMTVSVIHNPKRSMLKSHGFLNHQQPGPPVTVIPRPFSSVGSECQVVFAPLCTPLQKLLVLKNYLVRCEYEFLPQLYHIKNDLFFQVIFTDSSVAGS